MPADREASRVRPVLRRRRERVPKLPLARRPARLFPTQAQRWSPQSLSSRQRQQASRRRPRVAPSRSEHQHWTRHRHWARHQHWARRRQSEHRARHRQSEQHRARHRQSEQHRQSEHRQSEHRARHRQSEQHPRSVRWWFQRSRSSTHRGPRRPSIPRAGRALARASPRIRPRIRAWCLTRRASRRCCRSSMCPSDRTRSAGIPTRAGRSHGATSRLYRDTRCSRALPLLSITDERSNQGWLLVPASGHIARAVRRTWQSKRIERRLGSRIVALKRWPQAPAYPATVASFRTWRGSQC